MFITELALPGATEPDTLELVDRCRRGDADAEQLLFRRYAERLLRLLQTRIPPGVGRRFGPDDVAQDVFVSFFRAVREDRIRLQRSGDLWAWLARIAHHKLVNLVKRQLALKRSLAIEEGWSISGSLEDDARLEVASREPGAHEALALADELDLLFGAPSSLMRRVVDLRLCDMSLQEIARRLEVSHTTVNRYLSKISLILEARLHDLESGEA